MGIPLLDILLAAGQQGASLDPNSTIGAVPNAAGMKYSMPTGATSLGTVNVGTPQIEVPAQAAPDVRHDVGWFDRALLGSGSQYLEPDDLSAARWQGILGGIAGLRSGGLPGGLYGAMVGGRQAVQYENALTTEHDWQAYAYDQARQAAAAGNVAELNRWIAARYSKPGSIPNPYYGDHPTTTRTATDAQGNFVYDANGNPVQETVMMERDASGEFRPRVVPGTRRVSTKGRLEVFSPYQKVEIENRDALILASRAQAKRWAAANPNFYKGVDANQAKVLAQANQKLSTESTEQFLDFAKSNPWVYTGSWTFGQGGAEGGAPTPEGGGAGGGGGAMDELRKAYGTGF